MALAVLTGTTGGVLMVDQGAKTEASRNRYIQAIAADPETSPAVKVAMVMGSYYESSYKHHGTPYIDKNGKGQPLTVCDGITGAGVVANKYYTEAECYQMGKYRYTNTEKAMPGLLTHWNSYDAYTRATFIDFGWNKGIGALASSTMRAKANAGDLQGACKQNERWTRGTVKNVSVVLPGLVDRANANSAICFDWSPVLDKK